ncbi:MAG: hypothetical protein ACLFRU_06230 [Paracoccaceae bacterium]
MPYGKTFLATLSTLALLAGPTLADKAPDEETRESDQTEADEERLVPTEEQAASEREEEQVDEPVRDVDEFDGDAPEGPSSTDEVGRDEPRTEE